MCVGIGMCVFLLINKEIMELGLGYPLLVQIFVNYFSVDLKHEPT